MLDELRRVFLQASESGSAGQGMGGISAAQGQHAALKMPGNMVAHQDRAHRHVPRCQALGQHHHVRHDAFMLDGEHLAGAAKAGDDFIGDEEDAVLVAQLPQAWQIAIRQREAAGRPGDRFDDDGRHRGRIFQAQLVFQGLQAKNITFRIGFIEITAVAVRIEEADSAGRSRLDGRAPRIAADSQGAIRGAVITAILGEDLGPARDEPRQDECLVIRLAAAVDEETFAQIAWCKLGQFLR